MRTIYRQVGRDARTGKFITIRRARRHPATSVVEVIRCRVGRHRRPSL